MGQIKWMDNIKWCIIPVLLVASLLITSVAKAETYSEVPNGIITMDVIKHNGAGGTWKCVTLKECYFRVLQAEERGATQYCSTIVIKRNGVPVWGRDYNSPYWVAKRDQSTYSFNSVR